MIDYAVFGNFPEKLSDRITALDLHHHSKASEAYLEVQFTFPNGTRWEGYVPVNYRRTGLDATTKAECIAILEAAYEAMRENKVKEWKAGAIAFWDASQHDVTRPFFDALLAKLGQWVCQTCGLPANPNWARRTQAIKEYGFTFATDTSRYCEQCGRNHTHLMLLPLPRENPIGYESWSGALRKRILRALGCYDAYESCVRAEASLLPDHKFPEIRWDAETRQENPDDMPDSEIREKFQLMTNQRNQQKREVCRACFQTGKRGTPFGIKFFYSGDAAWPKGVPQTGKKAEKGCHGCGWYDLEKWRQALNQEIP